LLGNDICFALLFWLIVKVQLIKEQCYELDNHGSKTVQSG
jgi:hypothetical protein